MGKPVPDPREPLGRLVRDKWVAWAREQPDPKPSWLTGWDELDEGQREVDMQIGDAVAKHAAQRCAEAILAHMENHSPMADWMADHRWRRHLGIAARTAALAFTTREELLRQAAEAILRGDYMACDIPEAPGDR